jgi:hypothetical protein
MAGVENKTAQTLTGRQGYRNGTWQTMGYGTLGAHLQPPLGDEGGVFFCTALVQGS